MRHRIVRGLRTACKSVKPQFASGRRPKGAKGRGIAYERTLASALGPDWTAGAWFHFLDAEGPGYCQTDFIRELADVVVVLEAKLSWVPEGRSQLELLYRPVCEYVYKKPMIGLVVCKRLVPECNGAIAHTLPSALEAARHGHNVVLHWIGSTPLAPEPQHASRGLRPLSVSLSP